MKESVYRSAMSKVRTSEGFEDETYRKLMAAAGKPASLPTLTAKERDRMQKTKKWLTGWTIGIAACAALSFGILTMNQHDPATTPSNGAPSSAAASPSAGASGGGLATTPATSSQAPSPGSVAKPPIRGKVAVNIDGVISEVSADGKSFKVGDLWVEVTEQTKLGSGEPTAAEPSEELLQKEFKVGNIVSGYTSQDVSTGKVTADVIYNNMAPQK